MRDDLGYQKAQWPKPSQIAVAPESPPVESDTNSAGFFANLGASLNVGFGSVVRELRRNRRQMGVGEVAPVFYRSITPIQLSATGFGIGRLTGPDQGHYWYVRKLVVGGTNDPSVAVPGRADVFVSAMDLRAFTSLAQIGLGDWQDFAIVLPNVAPYSKGELTMRFNEELYVIITNGTANGQYTAAASVQDFQESNNAQDWDV